MFTKQGVENFNHKYNLTLRNYVDMVQELLKQEFMKDPIRLTFELTQLQPLINELNKCLQKGGYPTKLAELIHIFDGYDHSSRGATINFSRMIANIINAWKQGWIQLACFRQANWQSRGSTRGGISSYTKSKKIKIKKPSNKTKK